MRFYQSLCIGGARFGASHIVSPEEIVLPTRYGEEKRIVEGFCAQHMAEATPQEEENHGTTENQ